MGSETKIDLMIHSRIFKFYDISLGIEVVIEIVMSCNVGNISVEVEASSN